MPSTSNRFAILKLNDHQPLPPNYHCVAHGTGPLVSEFLNLTRVVALDELVDSTRRERQQFRDLVDIVAL
jgi:hypothetical protein